MTAAQELETAKKFWSDFISAAHELADDAGHCETYDQIISDARARVPIPEGFMDPNADPKSYSVRRKVVWVVEVVEEVGVEEIRVFNAESIIKQAEENCFEELNLHHLAERVSEIIRSESAGLPSYYTMKGYEVTYQGDDPSEWEIFED